MVIALAGCGGDESGWQAEFREEARQDVARGSASDPALVLVACESLATDYEATTQALIRNFNDDFRGQNIWRMLEYVILPRNELELTPSILDEAVRIFLNESEKVCP